MTQVQLSLKIKKIKTRHPEHSLTPHPLRKQEILSSELCQISGDQGEFGIPNQAWMSLIKCYQMLRNARVAAFTISELLREKQQGGKITHRPAPLPKLGLRFVFFSENNLFLNVFKQSIYTSNIPPIYLFPFEKIHTLYFHQLIRMAATKIQLMVCRHYKHILSLNRNYF